MRYSQYQLPSRPTKRSRSIQSILCLAFDTTVTEILQVAPRDCRINKKALDGNRNTQKNDTINQVWLCESSGRMTCCCMCPSRGRAMWCSHDTPFPICNPRCRFFATLTLTPARSVVPLAVVLALKAPSNAPAACMRS